LDNDHVSMNLNRATSICMMAVLAGLATLSVGFITAPPHIAPAPAGLSLSVTTGAPGTPVTISGNGFPRGEVVALYVDVPGPYLFNPGPRADSSGAITAAIVWPDKNYDTTHHLDPSTPGPHTICGDTGYPGSTQPIAAKACATFNVLAVPSPSSATIQSATPAAAPAGSPTGTVLVVVAIMIVLAVVAFLLLRRAE
jgi:hypothetical protein